MTAEPAVPLVEPGTMKIAGLDPSLTSFGIAVTEGPGQVELIRLRTRLRGHERIVYLLDALDDHVAGCDVAAVEDVVILAAGRDARVNLAGLHWMVRHRLWERGIPYAVVAPSTRAKWLTGNGHAGKDECLAAAIKRFTMADITGNDEADALTLAAMCGDAYGCPLVKMPQDRTALLHDKRNGQPKVAWPRL